MIHKAVLMPQARLVQGMVLAQGGQQVKVCIPVFTVCPGLGRCSVLLARAVPIMD